MELSGKDEKAVTRVTERSKPTLVTIGNRQVISSGRWNNELMADHILVNGRLKWLTIGELSKVAYNDGSPRNKKRVRQCLHQLFRTLMLKHGELLVIEYGSPNNRAKAVKLFDCTSEIDRQNLEIKLDRMRKRRELSMEQYENAVLILQDKEVAA
mgnify:CR=1 FL=1